LPALGAARKSARMIQCLSNERQNSLAMTMYSEQNGERFPPLTVDLDGNGDGGNTGTPLEGPWWVRLGQAGVLASGSEQDLSDGGQNALVCPSDVDSGSGLVVNYWAD